MSFSVSSALVPVDELVPIAISYHGGLARFADDVLRPLEERSR